MLTSVSLLLWQHWEFVDEGKPGQPKLGFRTLLPDTSLEVQARPLSSCMPAHKP